MNKLQKQINELKKRIGDIDKILVVITEGRILELNTINNLEEILWKLFKRHEKSNPLTSFYTELLEKLDGKTEKKEISDRVKRFKLGMTEEEYEKYKKGENWVYQEEEYETHTDPITKVEITMRKTTEPKCPICQSRISLELELECPTCKSEIFLGELSNDPREDDKELFELYLTDKEQFYFKKINYPFTELNNMVHLAIGKIVVNRSDRQELILEFEKIGERIVNQIKARYGKTSKGSEFLENLFKEEFKKWEERLPDATGREEKAK